MSIETPPEIDTSDLKALRRSLNAMLVFIRALMVIERMFGGAPDWMRRLVAAVLPDIDALEDAVFEALAPMTGAGASGLSKEDRQMLMLATRAHPDASAPELTVRLANILCRAIKPHPVRIPRHTHAFKITPRARPPPPAAKSKKQPDKPSLARPNVLEKIKVYSAATAMSAERSV